MNGISSLRTRIFVTLVLSLKVWAGDPGVHHRPSGGIGPWDTGNFNACAPTTLDIQAWHYIPGQFQGYFRFDWSLYRNNQMIASFNQPWDLRGNNMAQNYTFQNTFFGIPRAPGTYRVDLVIRRRVGCPFNCHFTVLQTFASDTFNGVATQLTQAPVPTIRLEVVADPGNDMIYRLRGWQTNGNASLTGQWNIFNSDNTGTAGALIVSNWSTPGPPYTINQTLNLGSWYLLQYGNYNDCLSWNDTKRLIYITKP